MFSLKRSSTEPNPTNFDYNTALPNNYGHVRTLKDDLAKFKSGKKEGEEVLEPVSPSSLARPAEKEPPNTSRVPVPPPASEQKGALFGSSSVKLTQKEQPVAPENNPQNDIPSSFGSETFFQTQSPFDEKKGIAQKETPRTSKKSSGKLIVILSSLLIFLALGGGFYYWWFFLESPLKKTAPKETSTSTQTKTPANSDVEQWIIDPKTDKIANKLAIERYVKNIPPTAAREKALEIKLVSKDNQPIPAEAFSQLFDFVLPASISEKLTSDYSLFVFYENEEPRLGAAFRLTPSDNLASSLKSEEADLFSNLKSFYLDKLPSDTQISFNSGKYKNADIRYFNFASPANTSLDYTVLSGKGNSYFIFSTSKNSIRAILDYMSEK